MATSGENQRILILMGCGEENEKQEVCDLYDTKYPERPINRSTVKFREIAQIKKMLVVLGYQETRNLILY